jgi:hypothetical protein
MFKKTCIALMAALAALTPAVTLAQTASCPADLNFDRWVDSADLSQLLLEFGDCFECPSDLDGDGVVNGGDVSLMLLDFGACPDGPGDNPCPPWGTFVSEGGPEPILYNDLTVGVRWWDVVATGWQRFTSAAPEGECTTFNTNYQSECYAYGTEVGRDAQFTYYADGNCAYFTGPTTPPNPCPAAATIISIDRAFTLTVTPLEGGCGQSYVVGQATRIQYHDGNCGTYWGWPILARYKPYGMPLGFCDTWEFFSDGVGGYYTTRNCPPAGVILEEISRTPFTVTITGGFEWILGYQLVVLETDGECGTRESSRYEWLPYGTILGSDGNYDYYSDGNGWYYTVPVGCPSAGTVLSSTSVDIFINVIGVEWKIGTNSTTTFADGNCGTYDLLSTEYLPYGTLLGTDGVSNYYSDGNGSYYANQCLAAGTQIYAYSSDLKVTIIPGVEWTIGTSTKTVYADGVCGTYEETSYTYAPYGSLLGTDGTYDYFSDGTGGYYTQPVACPPQGTVISENSGAIAVTVGGNTWQIGTVTDTTYADGACGTYVQSVTEYLGFGTFLGNDGTCDYFSDGAGSYYSSNCG